jgi:hypothetical protein
VATVRENPAGIARQECRSSHEGNDCVEFAPVKYAGRPSTQHVAKRTSAHSRHTTQQQSG